MKIFVLEDDSWYSDIIEYHLLLNSENEVEKFDNAKDFFDNFYKKPDMVTLDYGLPDMKGESVLKKIQEQNPNLPVIIISGQEDISTAVKLLSEGAFDYIVKDDQMKDRLWSSMLHVQKNIKLQAENIQLKEEVHKKYSFENTIIGRSQPIQQLFSKMNRAINNNITVSVTGETGTGKELVAKAIHYNSNRSKQTFIAINVGAVPPDLLESELFGHEKGSFTGASSRRIGKFEEAHKGTLFLDEVAEMDLSMQTKLLRVLQEKEIFRIGSNKAVKIDVRIITATHKDLKEEVKKGNFRQDLYFRLLGLPIQLPPLRERDQDVIILAKHFSDEFCKENKRKKMKFSSEAKNKLIKYPFPGNVRELKAVIELAVIMSDDDIINEDAISFDATDSVTDLLLVEKTLDLYTVDIIRHFLEIYNRDAILVAKKLGVAKSTIYRYINKYDL